MKSVFCVITFLIIFTGFDALSQEVTSRSSLMFNGKVDLEDYEVFGTFFPSTDLVSGLAPLMYAGFGIKTEYVTVGPVIGYSYLDDEPIVSVQLFTSYKEMWGWFDFEWYTVSQFGYVFGQTEIGLLDWLGIGIEYEFWGNFGDNNWSLGGGPNLVLSFSRLGLESSFHTRDENGIRFEFVSRICVYL